MKVDRRKFMGGAAGILQASAVVCLPPPSTKVHWRELPAQVAKNAPAPLTAWIFVRNPLERWLSDYRRMVDAWEEGGVRGIVVGRLVFVEEDGSLIPSFPSDSKVYDSFGVKPPEPARRNPEKERQLCALLDDAAGRGWEILVFGPGRRGGDRPLDEDPFGAVGFAAGAQDTLNAYPQAQGVIVDGAGEYHYELAFHHGAELFDIRDEDRPGLAAWGADIARIERGIAHLRERFHNLTPSRVRYHSPGGMLGGLALFDLNEDALYWLRVRQEASLSLMAALRKQIDGLKRKIKLGTIPRTATFSVLTAQDYEKTHRYFDYLFPKHYFWHRGWDGFYGTIARWVQRIGEWNPGLSESDCFAVVKAWFGIELPGISSLADMEMGFPDEFFSEIVYSETRRALEAVGNPDKVIAWVSSGRRPHAGDPMPARDLYRILRFSQQAGLRRFVYHPSPDLGVPEWSVISGLCGKRWKEDPGGYWIR